MSKGQQFWLDIWQQEHTPFHKSEVNPDLILYWPALNIKPNSTVLVPLCGKSLDLLWLAEQGFRVVGIELSEKAVLQFFAEHDLTAQSTTYEKCTHYFSDRISIWVGDIFALEPSHVPEVDAIYDRAALIALPPSLRQSYVSTCLQWLKPKGSVLLKTLSYDQQSMQGPPYSVQPEEVNHLYQGRAAVSCLKATMQGHSLKNPMSPEAEIVTDDYVWGIVKQ